MNNDELKQKIMDIFPEEGREEVEIEFEKYIQSGKLGLTVSIHSGLIYGSTLDVLKFLLWKEGYIIHQLCSNNGEELSISFIPGGVL
jgi:hypothetical protein